MLAGVPGQGGASWAVLQYVLGLRRLGHDVLFVEPVPNAHAAGVASYFADIVRGFGLEDAAALVEPGGHTLGLSRSALLASVDEAELLLNLSGVLDDEELLERIPVRAFVDLDPAFTQLWHEVEGIDQGLDRHNRFVTIGQAIGQPGCSVPTCGRAWITTPQPVVLEQWPVAEGPATEALTTVGHWRAYGSIHHAGVHYGQKAHAMRELFDVARRAPVRFELALAIHPDEHDDLDALDRHGWALVDPCAVAASPRDYRAFVRRSWAEFGLAKLGYVASACGWFSDRSVCYLASGRPVLAQDTGFGPWLPVDEGVIAFHTADEAVAATEALRSDYARHRRAARMVAEEVFDSDRVLARLLACL